jgi:preprotein translocase subunit SecG
MVALLWTGFIFVCILLLVVILLQKGDVGGIGAAFGGGGGDTAFGVKADTTWKKATAALAGVFIVLAMALGTVTSKKRGNTIANEAPQEAPVAPPADGGAGGGE